MSVLFAFLYTACSDYDFKEIQEGENASDTASSNNVDDTGTSSTVTDSGHSDTAITEDPDVATEIIYLNSGSTLFMEPRRRQVIGRTIRDSSVRR